MDLSTQNPIIKAIGLSKQFRDFWNRPKANAVNDIDFEIHEGEIVGLLGPNGSGKSTTVKMLLGLLYPTAGELKVFGKSPRDVKAKQQIGYLPEESYLYKYLTAMETLDFFGSLFNLSYAERRSRSEQLLEMVGLSHAKRRPVGEFSKGMARRIGLAQAMINDPALLILDEPTSGLDPLGCKEVKDLILLMKKRGKTVVVTSHLLSDVEDVCDRVIILYGGKVRATGTLKELLTIPEESRITTPLLKPDVTEKVLKILRENMDGEEFRIDHPRKSLEDFFLEVISKAKADSVETSGVVGGGRIATYLNAEEEKKAVLSDLVSAPQVKPPEKAEEKAEEKEIDRKEEKRKLDVKIESLVESDQKKKEFVPQPEPAEKGKDLNDVNKKLKDLLK